MKKGNVGALLPILVFLALYLVLGVILGTGLPVVVAFMAAILVACLQNKSLTLTEKFTVMAKSVGDKDILIMVLIFFTAGIFSSVVGRSSAQSVAYFLLSIVPARFAVAVLFVVACFVSTAMGTSCGTIALITPIGVEIALASGFDVALCIATVIGGAMFGDNLSFISDTTIAACNGQGCRMKDKFKENFFIALPAAVATLIIVLFATTNTNAVVETGEYNLVQIVPYIIVMIGGIIGINVFVVLMTGIFTGAVIMLTTGGTASIAELLGNMNGGVTGMYETATVAILVSAMCALIREYGGFDALLSGIKKVFRGKKGGQLGMGVLVGLMDIATANNTVAIVVANPIAKEMSEEYGISPSKTASLLDTFSCIFQGIIPYGAQMLLAIGGASVLGVDITAFEIIPKLFYPFFLCISSLVFIFIIPEKKKK